MPSPEGDRREGISEIPPKVIVFRILGDSTRLGILLDGRKSQSVLRGFKDQVGGYSSDETKELVGILLTGLGSSDGPWNADSRDGALQLLGAIPFENKKVKPEDLLENYLAVLEEQVQYIDPLGSPLSLAKAGLILVPHLPPTSDTVKRVRAGWDRIQRKLGTKPEWKAVDSVYSSLETRLVRHKQKFNPTEKPADPDDSAPPKKKSTVKIDPELPGKVAVKLEQVEDPKVRDICESYFGIDKPPEVQREIGKRHGLTQAQVSLIINKALRDWGLKSGEKRSRNGNSSPQTSS